MNTKYLLSIILMLFEINSINAQGTWTGESATSFVYDFGAGTGNAGTTYNAAAAAKSSVSTDGTPGFLPYPVTGSARVYTAAASSSGGFSIAGSPASVTITASNAAAGNKLSVYNVAELSSVTSTFFNVSFNNTTATTGALIYAFGNSANITEENNIFNNATSLASTQTAGVFNFLRWDMPSTGNAITFSYRTALGAGFATINSSTFSKTGSTYAIEIYANNSAAPQEYTRSSIVYTLPSATFNIWVNGARILGASSLVNFPSTGELAIGQPLNSLAIQASRSTAGPLLATTFGNITIKYITQSTLPVSLSSFFAKKNGQMAILNWETASEQSNAYFDIMRSSSEGEQFEKIGRVAGNGNSQKVINYSFTDFNPLAGTNYYLLKQFDTDGKFTDSGIASITIAEDSKFQATSIDGKLYVKLSSEVKGNGKITISDITGKRIIEEKLLLNKGNNNFNYDISGIQNGVYIATVSSGSITKSVKFFK